MGILLIKKEVQKMNNILVINPGSTSTKIAWYCGKEKKWGENIEHDPAQIKTYAVIYDQLEMRTQLVLKTIADKGETVDSLSAVVSRGGLLGRVSAGAYEVNDAMVEVLRDRPVNHHASNLGAAIALHIARQAGVKAYIYDPVTVDEMIDLVRITGLKEVQRFGQGHNLNMRAAALRLCKEENMDYGKSNIIVAHLGGGITLSLHSQGRIIDMISDDEGAFSPERAGALPIYRMLSALDEKHLDYAGTMKLLQRGGGLTSWFGTSDTRTVEKMALEEGNAQAKLVYDAMALSVARSIAKLAVVVDGSVDRIVLTGGIAYSKYFCGEITRRVSFIASVTVYAGENEMEALALGALRVLTGEETAHVFEEK